MVQLQAAIKPHRQWDGGQNVKPKSKKTWAKTSTIMIMIINENSRKTNYANEKQFFIINWPMSSLFPSTAPHWLPFFLVYVLIVSYGVEYSFDQRESAIQLCPLPTPYSLNIYPLPGQDGKLKSVTYCKHCSISTKNQCLINIFLILTLKHSTVLPARKKIDSIPAETRQGRKTIVLLFMVLLLFGLVWFDLVWIGARFQQAFKKGYLNWKFEVEKKINNGSFLW